MLSFYEFNPDSNQTHTTKYDYTDREQTFFKKDDTPKPKGLTLFQIVSIIICIFLSIVIYGTFNIESLP